MGYVTILMEIVIRDNGKMIDIMAKENIIIN